jgi:hypothetical protein
LAKRARLVYLLMNVGTLLLVAIAIATLALEGHPPWFSIGAGVLWGVVPFGLVFALAEAAAPGVVIRWREEVMARDVGFRRQVGEKFSKWLAISGSRPWESPSARIRVRVLGLALLIFWLAVSGVALWVSS